MSFTCPECQTPRNLGITQRIELPADSRSDEIALQLLKCRSCGFNALAIYEESRRGALDDDSFDHTGYHATSDELERIRQLIEVCPDISNSRCDCESHRILSETNEYGRNDLTRLFSYQGSFALIYNA